MHRMLLQDLGCLKLRLDHVLLQTLPHAIPGFRNLLNLPQLVLIAIENRQRLRVIEQLEINLFDLFFDCTLRRFVTMPGVVGVSFRLGLLRAELAGTRDVLRDAEAGVIKIAAFVAGKRLRTSNREMLERHLRIGQRRRLDWHLRCSLPMAPRREHDRAARESLINQRSQSIRTDRCIDRLSAILRTSRRRNDSQNCGGKQRRQNVSRR